MKCACAILLYVVKPTLQYSSTLLQKRQDFQINLLNAKCVFWFALQGLSETFPILRRNERDMIKNVYRSSRKLPLNLVRF